MMESTDARRPQRRQDTFDLRNQIHAHTADGQQGYFEEHSILEDSSDADEGDLDDVDRMQDHDADMQGDDELVEYMSDTSSSLSIPNESIDFDLVYSLTNFAATVEGQASVVKGDSLFLMDDSNSYWWLVRVLKTQEVGYIPAENIETPFERLARLNRHRNVDLASATQAEMAEDFKAAQTKRSMSRTQARARVQMAAAASSDSNESGKRGVIFKPRESIYRYPPAVWNEEDDDADEEWDEDEVDHEERLLNDIPAQDGNAQRTPVPVAAGMPMDEDDMAAVAGAGVNMQAEDTQMSWEEVEDPMRPQQQQQLHRQTSRERLLQQEQQQEQEQEQDRERQMQAQVQQDQGAGRAQPLDPAVVTDTKKIVITPSVARDAPLQTQEPVSAQQQSELQKGPLLPSAILSQQQAMAEQEKKRAREEIEAAEEVARKRGAATNSPVVGGPGGLAQQSREIVRTPSQETRSSVSSSTSSSGKLRKEPQRPGSSSDRDRETEDGRDGNEKKKRGMFGGLFSRKKEKDKGRDKGSMENIAAAAAGVDRDTTRISEESGLSSSHSHSLSGHGAYVDPGRGGPSPSGLRQQQQQRGSPQGQQIRTESPVQRVVSPQEQQQTQQQTQSALASSVSPLASQLRERDQQQQAMYSEYLKRSPSSPPEQPSYGLQSAPAIMPSLSASSSGPVGLGATTSPNSSGYGTGLTPSSSSRPGGRPGSLILIPSMGMGGDGQGTGTGLSELSVIRVFAGKNLQSEATFKTVLLNSSTTASELVRQSMQRFRLAAGEDVSEYYLTVKQFEGTTLKLNSEEKPLGVFEQLVEEALEMPKVKRSSMGSISSIASNLSSHPAIKKLAMNDFTDDSAVKFYLNRRTEDGDDSLTVEDDDTTMIADASYNNERDSTGSLSNRGQFLTVQTGGLANTNVSPERFTSPSYRFGMQVVIFPEELPDNMVFDPLTEAIVPKETLRDRSQSSNTVNPGPSQTQRKKYFVFPKNITVAEVIELSLERFGIPEGVVDGGDEVEDKLTKRRSASRVRYMLTVQIEGQERELPPSTKIIDAFPRPPVLRRSTEMKRRSIDSAQLLGNVEDVQADDPVFVLRRAVAYRSSGASRHRLQAPLDEIALNHLHRDSSASSSGASESSVSSTNNEESKARQPSRQEIIAAQRATARGNQKAMLSTQVNQHRGVDVMLPDKAMLRSQRLDVDNRMRYSYVQPDGETYDISEIIEEELGGEEPKRALSPSGPAGSDLLNGAISSTQHGDGARLIDRLLNKINEKAAVPQSASASTFRSTSPSMYSDDGHAHGGANEASTSRSVTPTSASALTGNRSPTPTATKDAIAFSSRSRSVTPTAANSQPSATMHRQQQPSIESVMSDLSAYRTATTNTPVPSNISSQPSSQARRPRIPRDEFGLTEMLAIIESKASLNKEPPPPPLDVVDRLLFGPKLDLDTVHPHIREVYGGMFKKMEDLDNELDTLLQKAMHIF